MKVFILQGRTMVLLALLFGAICTAGFVWSRNQVMTASVSVRSLPIYSVDTEEKVAALGINCAWDNNDIPQMLKTLSDNQVKATFFILGQWCEKYPDSVKQIAAAGHEIASHGYSHTNMTSMETNQIAQEATKSMQVLEQATGQKPILLRPPSGDYNDRVIETIEGLGYIPIQWDVDTLDWQGLQTEEMLLRVTTKTQPGSILLLHSGAKYTAEALPEFIKSLKESGYTIKPVGEIIYKENYTIDVQGRQHKSGS